MKLPKLNLHRWFVPMTPQLATSSGGDDRFGSVLFSSRQGGNGDDYGFGDDDETAASETPTESSRSGRGGGSGGDGGNRGNGAGGRQRTIQFQPEDRYWTEYLRIALPIIGLILMLGLFWFWATKIIGDDTDGNTDPVPEETLGAVDTVEAGPTETPAATQASTVASTQAPTEAADPTEPAAADDAGGDEATEAPPTEGEEPTEEPADSGGGDFAADDVVTVNDTDVNLRETAPDGDVVATLTEGDTLTIVSGPETAGEFDWYEVVTEDGTTTGFVASQFLDPSE